MNKQMYFVKHRKDFYVIKWALEEEGSQNFCSHRSKHQSESTLSGSREHNGQASCECR